MGRVTGILQTIFVQRFYIQNTLFFLVLFYLLFGVVNGGNLVSYHRSLMMGFLGSLPFLLIVLALWALYGLKCAGFVLKTFQTQGFEFLYPTLGSLEKHRRMRLWLLIHCGIYLPVLVYGGVAAAVGIAHRLYVPAALVVVFNVLMCLWPLAVYERKLHHPDVNFFTGHLQRWLNRRFTKPPVLYFIYELLSNYPRRILGVKLACAGILWLTFYLLRETGGFDIRGLALGLMLCVIAHGQLMMQHRAFDDTYLGFLRQLPQPLWQHYLRLAGVYILLFIPEMAMMAANNIPPAALLTCFALAMSMLLLFRCLLYFPKMNAEIHMRYVLLSSFVTLFLVLGGYGWLAVAVMLPASLALFLYLFRSYETYVDQES
ncbi:hypothetical protein [Chitinophaga barathri]|uniref:Uncharacterized protein n=1 Tax=Chitinophaga barathri TaxID=1647451 RepID=A0A3N4MB22_9BACT|nr:hypothetical protein [Chitinophaga barathri]RPD38607.1 hypothetical protein EG028_23105 [Chitinophaga barathri]